MGDKYVKETLLAGWTLSNITCTLGGAEIVIGTGINGTFAAGATNGFDPGDTSVKVTMTAGDTPSCEFENTKNASLDIEKQTSGGTGTFSYTVSGSGLVDFTRNTAVDQPDAEHSVPLHGSAAGRQVREGDPAGWMDAQQHHLHPRWGRDRDRYQITAPSRREPPMGSTRVTPR